MLAALSSAAFVRRFRGGRSRRLRRERQGGQGLVSRSHARLNLRLDGLVRRACAKNCLDCVRLGRARSLARNARMPATPATDREPRPRPPCRCYLVCLGRVSVSRPIEGLDSLRAVRTLRTSCLRANGSASRLPSRLHGRVRSYVYATTSPQADMSRSKRHGLTSCTVARLCWMNFADAKRPRCWQVSVASAACGWRRSCRAPRWGETRHLFPNKPSSSGRVDGGLDRGPLQAWRAPARGRASAERGPAAVLPKQS